jgi:hypothetical protein
VECLCVHFTTIMEKSSGLTQRQRSRLLFVTRWVPILAGPPVHIKVKGKAIPVIIWNNAIAIALSALRVHE